MGAKTKQIGYFCPLVPEEIMMAAGLEPVRMAGEAESTSAADGHLYHNLCPYIKNVMSIGLGGGAKHLDGVVFARSCDGMRRMYDAWRTYIDTPFVYMLEVPKNTDEPALKYYASQLRDFASAVGQAFDARIDEASLRAAIKKVNKFRQAAQDVFALQRSKPLPVKGSDLFAVGARASTQGRDAALKEIKALSNKAGRAKPDKTGSRRPRILISGNIMDKPDLFELLEAAGADIPAADLCTDLRYFSRQVDGAAGDPYLALAQAYLGEPHCSRTASPIERTVEIQKLIRDYSIDGVLLTSLKFCDLHLYDAPYITETLKNSGVPVLFLENDYTFTNRGQLKVRIEAFIEVLNEKRD
ncbi:MAG: 2-hydroxyacyl-CoA dehydratase family protein [Dehalococcoidia bacterium]|nr:2-hydroxyacyl-CoA dehydratase family protein [Dehalococcoidia bacterium]MDD5495157.1 2-hydroxyacyl-CoA dehydratase family protein [Dehalococcoidia bacterium]